MHRAWYTNQFVVSFIQFKQINKMYNIYKKKNYILRAYKKFIYYYYPYRPSILINVINRENVWALPPPLILNAGNNKVHPIMYCISYIILAPWHCKTLLVEMKWESQGKGWKKGYTHTLIRWERRVDLRGRESMRALGTMSQSLKWSSLRAALVSSYTPDLSSLCSILCELFILYGI